MIYNLVTRRRDSANIDFRVMLVFFPLPYVLAQYLFLGDFGQLSRFLNLFAYSFVGGVLVARLSGDAGELAGAFVAAIAIQSLIIIFSFFSLGYRSWFELNVLTGANYGADNLYRAPGLSSSAGSALSVLQSIGVLAGGIYIRLKTPNEIGRPYLILSIASMILSAASCLVVGRTGLLMSMIFMLGAIIWSGYFWAFLIVILFSGILSFVVGGYILDNLLPSQISLDFMQQWMFGFFKGEDGTVSALASMPIPPISFDSFLGYGLVSIIDGANPSGHDSGFIQAYYSMGAVVSLFFFLAYFYVLRRLLGWLSTPIAWLLTMLFFGIEIKEPFVFKYGIMFLLVAFYAVVRRDRAVSALAQ
jgi:hypothetical protein